MKGGPSKPNDAPRDDAGAGAPAAANALRSFAEIAGRLAGRPASVFLDYDGTLTPIAARPELAPLSDEMRATLGRLAQTCTVAVISGRDLDDVRRLVGLDGLIYAGSHGFDIAGPRDLRIRHENGTGFMAAVERAAGRLRAAVRHIDGALVEPKRFAVAVHYRQVAPEDAAGIEAAVDQVVAAIPQLRKTRGKKVFELLPRLDWDKGKALLWLIEALDQGGADAVPFYLGDDATDEDAFRALRKTGVTILVGPARKSTAARYVLRDPAEVGRFLSRLAQLLEDERKG